MLAIGALGASNWALERWARQSYGVPGMHKIKIESKTRTRDIAAILRREGLIDRELPLLAWIRIHGREWRTLSARIQGNGARIQSSGTQIQAGEYEIQTPITPQALLLILRRGRFERSLTIPEGWTARQIARRLAGEGWIPDEQPWLDLVARPLGSETLGEALPGGAEGFCYPDTYRFESGTKADEILRRMLAKFKREWAAAEPSRRDARSANLSLRQVVTLASMIEREGAHGRGDAENRLGLPQPPEARDENGMLRHGALCVGRGLGPAIALRRS